MAFWIYMLIMDLLIPFTMIGFGRYFLKKAPKSINVAFGYRTAMSMKNKDTWVFAHHYCGKRWYVWGLILLPCSVIAMLFLFGKSIDVIGIFGAMFMFLQMIPLVGTIFPTERALKRTFDQNGMRKQEKLQ